MDYGKYIIIEHQGHEIAIMFDSLLTHSDIISNIKVVVSAGFFMVSGNPTDIDKDDIEVCAFGKSVSLKKGSRPQDQKLLKKVIRKEIE